jgi:hypothetical protein
VNELVVAEAFAVADIGIATGTHRRLDTPMEGGLT